MTAVPKDPAISELRELFRYLQDFRAVYETTGLEVIRTPYGNEWSLWDLEYLYQASQRHLTSRQKQAISLCLVHNMREKDAAAAMGVSLTNPVMMYATLGIRRLLDMITNGELELFRSSEPTQLTREQRRRKALYLLADRIKSEVAIADGNCWLYGKLNSEQPPRIIVRSVYASSGFLSVHPLSVMYEAHIGPIPRNAYVSHVVTEVIQCVNPDHGILAQRWR
jgi:hypothetical protein